MDRHLGLLLLISVALVAADPGERIRRVETGLRPPIVIKGQPIQTMTIADRLKFYGVPGASVAVISGGKLEWARAYGATSSAGGGLVNTDTLFQAASISKPITAMIALGLVDLGKLTLDEDVNRKLRSWKVPENDFTKKEKVTLRRLLNHSAGITIEGFDGYAAGGPLPSLLQMLEGRKPANHEPIRVDVTPGSKWRYSGGGYVVVQQLVTDITGKSFGELAREFVFAPLGMSHSMFEQPLPARYQTNAAVGHGAEGLPLKEGSHAHPELAAAGLWTTPSDLARVVLEIQGGGGLILKPSTQREMLTRLLGHYGLGVFLGEKNGAYTFSHGGSNYGFQCDVFAFLNKGDGAIVMTNGDRGSRLVNEILRSIAAEYNWTHKRSIEKTVVPVDPEVLRSYAGEYRTADGERIIVSFESGHLFFKPPRLAEKTQIFPESVTSFFSLLNRVPPILFARQADGSIELTAGSTTATRR